MYNNPTYHFNRMVQGNSGHAMAPDPIYDQHVVMAKNGNSHIAQQAGAKQHRDWSPYVNNGGTVMGLAGTNPDGSNYALLAADTRMSDGYSISSRHVPKLFHLTDRCVLASSGMQADIAALVKYLRARLVMFRHQHGYEMTTEAMAQLLSVTLYGRRFFPYYTFNVLGGLDAAGNGVVYSYDAVGNFECTKCSVSGTGQSLIQPVLDNQVAQKNQLVRRASPDLEQNAALDLLKDAFNAAAERDIYTGDTVEVYILNSATGISKQTFELRKD